MAGGDAINIQELTGDALTGALDDLADLRIAIFRDYPYLYDGSGVDGRAYERGYLSAYADNAQALIVGAYAGDQLVGAATAAPMADHAADLAAPFDAHGIDIGDVYYFGESVLLPQWRGHGVGHAFFDRREAKARELGFPIAAFCAVVRPSDHPERPADYSPLDPFWRRRGFAPVAGLIASFGWKDMTDTHEIQHAMQYWLKRLD